MKGRGLVPLREALRIEFGPPAFWKEYGRLWYRARKQGRTYLTWEEWDHAVELAERHELFLYFQGGRDGRRDEAIRASDFLHVSGATMLFLAFRRMRQARARGLSPWQFALEEDRRVDGVRVAERELHELEIARTQAARKAAADDRRGKGSRPASTRRREGDRDDQIPLPD